MSTLSDIFQAISKENKIEFEKDFYIISNGKSKRLILEDNFITFKKLTETDIEMEQFSQTFSIDLNLLKSVYYKCSGNYIDIINYFNNKHRLSELWNIVEDEVILTDDLEQMEILINKRGINSVMQRRAFLNHFKNYKF